MEPATALQSFWNGHWLPHHELHVDVDDLGFMQGVTAVERMRTYGGRPFQVRRHLHRFESTVTALQIAGLPDRRAQQQILDELLQRNRSWLNEQREAGIVLYATPGHAGRPALRLRDRKELAVDSDDAQPTFAAYLSPLPMARIADRLRTGQPLLITDVMQPSAKSWPRHLKVRSRLHYFLADLQATEIDPNALGVLLDEDRTITETSVANLAIVQAKRIVSPPAERVLPGVTQAVAEEIAAELGIEWEKRPLVIEEARDADEVLLFGTTIGIWPGWLVASGGQHGDAAGLPEATERPSIGGPVFQALRTRFDAVCRGE